MPSFFRHRMLPALALTISFASLQAQDAVMDSLLQTPAPATTYVRLFAGSRIANAQSVETLPRNILDFKIQHRFGSVEDGWEGFFGLDNATTRLGLDYGVTDNLEIGLGRASLFQQWDAFVKYRFMRQSTGQRARPITLTGFASAMWQSTANLPDDYTFSDRMYYAVQLMAARRFGNSFTLQIMPTMVHYNRPIDGAPGKQVWSMGAGTSWKVARFMSLNAEYFYNFPGSKIPGTTNAIAFGIDFETGGHVFQIMMTNSQGIAERPFITEGTGNFFDGDIHFGFNISRVFDLSRLGKHR